MSKRLTPPWQFDKPLCSEIGSYYFYMEDDGISASRSEVNKVKALCNTCIHQVDCLEWGIQKETFGIWGGLNPRERNLIKRRRRANVKLTNI